jgi:hypothetical protein
VPARPSMKGSVFVVSIRGKKLNVWAEVCVRRGQRCDHVERLRFGDSLEVHCGEGCMIRLRCNLGLKFVE